MHTLYFIPGLGADERLFSKLKLEGYSKKYIKWIAPFKNESLPAYAKRISVQINTTGKFSLVGVSFGGMIAVELSKLITPENIFLIASAVTYHELPLSFRLFKYLPIYKLFTESFICRMAKLSKDRFGVKKEEVNLFLSMLLSCPPGYFKSTLQMIFEWKNEIRPANVLHLHGDNDKLLPIRGVKNVIVVKGGTHFMPYHNYEEIENILLKKLEEKQITSSAPVP